MKYKIPLMQHAFFDEIKTGPNGARRHVCGSGELQSAPSEVFSAEMDSTWTQLHFPSGFLKND